MFWLRHSRVQRFVLLLTFESTRRLLIIGLWFSTCIFSAYAAYMLFQAHSAKREYRQLFDQFMLFQEKIAKQASYEKVISSHKPAASGPVDRTIIRALLLKHIGGYGISCRAVASKRLKKALKRRIIGFTCRGTFSQLLTLLKAPLPDVTMSVHSLTIAKRQNDQVAFEIMYKINAV